MEEVMVKTAFQTAYDSNMQQLAGIEKEIMEAAKKGYYQLCLSGSPLDEGIIALLRQKGFGVILSFQCNEIIITWNSEDVVRYTYEKEKKK